MKYAAIKVSTRRAHRGYPEEVEHQRIAPDWEGQLREYASLLGLPWKQPGWWLVSWMG